MKNRHNIIKLNISTWLDCFEGDRKIIYFKDGLTISKELYEKLEKENMEKKIVKHLDLETNKELYYEVQEDGTLKLTSNPKGKFVPELGEKCYRVSAFGTITSFKFSGSDGERFFMKNGGLYFRTQEDAQEYLDFLNLLNKYKHEFTQEEWKDGYLEKYFIYYDCDSDIIGYNKNGFYKSRKIYFKNETDAKEFVYMEGTDNIKRFMFNIWD